MPDYDDELSGVLFPARERRSDKSPNFTGRCTIGGVDYRIAAWTREARSSGSKFLSLSFTTQDEVAEGRGGEDHGGLDL